MAKFYIFLFFILNSNVAMPSDQSDRIDPEIFDNISLELNIEKIENSIVFKKKGKPIIGDKWMIVTANPYATVAGAEILESGGSAADAMVAAQSVLGLVEPESSGLGGGSFLVWYDSNSQKITTLDGRETAPENSITTQFQSNDGKPIKFYEAVIGGLSVGTPGTPALMYEAQKKWGNKDWSSLFDYAIKLSETGFIVSKKLSSSIERDLKKLSKVENSKNYFLPGGEPLKYGKKVKNISYAKTLRRIANEGIDIFYDGLIAKDIVNTVQDFSSNPGFLNKNDLKNYQVIQREPVCIKYKEYDICGMGPPSSGGVAVAQILKILEKFDLKKLGKLNPVSWQLIGDATRLAFADRDLYLADSDFVNVPVAGLINEQYLKGRSDLIKKGIKTNNITAGSPLKDVAFNLANDHSIELESTTHISIYDQYGNALSMTSSVENAFGSRLMTESGFLLNNQLTDFSFQHMSDEKLIANRLEPGKRPRSSMAPTIVLKDSKPFIIIGSPGGSNIIGFVANTIISMLVWDADIQQAVSMPHAINRWGKYEIENSTSTSELLKSLESMGYETQLKNYFSGLNGIHIFENTIFGGSDPRREGIAIGN